MRVDPDTAARLAALAHLDLDEDELERISGDLSRVLDYVDLLREVELAGPAPAGTGMATPLRDDRAGLSLPREAVESNAPDFRHGFFVVPRVIGGE